ncbi:MAG: hypothetical protein KAT05_03050 [Spirochaetes bacterium]|nr:hypothetical protein [Spirochaetota bacterium]
MKKKFFIFLLLFLLSFCAFSKNRFFLQNRLGALIKVDPASAYKLKHAEKKGPTLYEIPKTISKEEMFNTYLKKVNPKEYEVLSAYYKIENDIYVLTINSDDLETLKKIENIFLMNRINVSSVKKIRDNVFEKRVLNKIRNDEEKKYLMSIYIKDNKYYSLDIDWQNIDIFKKLREIFLKYNLKNEMYTGLDQHGTPMPHNFPRVHEAKSKAHFDIHFSWGVRLENNLTIGFAFNITNFTMFSLELLMIKYNFDIPNYPFEPYVGGALYGGYADGFPIGINFLAGFDFFPLSTTNNNYENDRNLFLTVEARIGPVIYIPTYYDTGLNTETIYKEIGVLMDGGLYFGYGYIFDN